MRIEDVGNKGLIVRFWFDTEKEAESFTKLPDQYKKNYVLVKHIQANVFINRAEGKYFKVAQVKIMRIIKTAKKVESDFALA